MNTVWAPKSQFYQDVECKTPAILALHCGIESFAVVLSFCLYLYSCMAYCLSLFVNFCSQENGSSWHFALALHTFIAIPFEFTTLTNCDSTNVSVQCNVHLHVYCSHSAIATKSLGLCYNFALVKITKNALLFIGVSQFCKYM